MILFLLLNVCLTVPLLAAIMSINSSFASTFSPLAHPSSRQRASPLSAYDAQTSICHVIHLYFRPDTAPSECTLSAAAPPPATLHPAAIFRFSVPSPASVALHSLSFQFPSEAAVRSLPVVYSQASKMAALATKLALTSSPCLSSVSLQRGSALPVVSVAPVRKTRAAAGRVVASAATTDIEELVSQIKNLTLIQARTLTDRLQEELGVSAAAMMPVAGIAAPAAGEAAAVVEEQTEFDLLLEEVPASSRIAVIKVVRAITGLGLKEAKDMIEGLPKKVKEAVAKEDAEDAKKQLEGAGAKCSIK
ncbi:unnamed protein product [Closterium sp. Yama58-4]|nr:unnamed protein product [Closterium sp. Yama58-4]